jgi:uncharacterized membrane protein
LAAKVEDFRFLVRILSPFLLLLALIIESAVRNENQNFISWIAISLILITPFSTIFGILSLSLIPQINIAIISGLILSFFSWYLALSQITKFLANNQEVLVDNLEDESDY